MNGRHVLRTAIALAERAVHDGIGRPFGAFAVHDGWIAGKGKIALRLGARAAPPITS